MPRCCKKRSPFPRLMVHWVSPGIGCVALTDELTAFQNHTAAIPAKQRAMIFAAPSYEEILSELDTVQEKQNTRLQTYREVYPEPVIQIWCLISRRL